MGVAQNATQNRPQTHLKAPCVGSRKGEKSLMIRSCPVRHRTPNELEQEREAEVRRDRGTRSRVVIPPHLSQQIFADYASNDNAIIVFKHREDVSPKLHDYPARGHGLP